MIKSVFKSGFLQMIGFGAGFVVHILLARHLSTEGYGVYNFIFALSSVLALFAAFGLPQATIRYMQKYIAGGDFAHLKGLLRFARAWPLFFGVVIGFCIYAALHSMGYFEDFIPVALMMIGLSLVPLLALVPIHAAILRGFNRITLSVFFETTFRDLVFAIILGGLFLRGVHLNKPAEALLILLGVLFMRAALATYKITRINYKNIDTKNPDYAIGQWLNTAWPMMLTVATRMLMVRTDLIVLGLMVGLFGLSNADLGQYAAAAKFAMLMALAQMAVMPFFAPNAARLYQQGKHAALSALFFKAQKLQALGGGILFCVFLLGGQPLLSFLGPDYAGAHMALIILVIGQFIGVACGPSSAVLEMSAYERQAMKVVLLFAGLNLVLTPALIVVMGIEGAALATSMSFVGQNVACYVVARRKGLIGREHGA